jgi:hypothetical protein
MEGARLAERLRSLDSTLAVVRLSQRGVKCILSPPSPHQTNLPQCCVMTGDHLPIQTNADGRRELN